MINDLCTQTSENLQKHAILSVGDVRNFEGVLAYFSEGLLGKIKEMRKFLFDNFYMNEKVAHKVENGKMMIERVFDYYLKELGDPILAKDYVAGMTDGFLVKEFAKMES